MDSINNIILENLDNLIFLNPYVIPIPKESILLDKANKKVFIRE